MLLWIDENHDGISQADELHRLRELGVYSWSLKYRDSRRVDQFGNFFRYKAAVNPDPAEGKSHDGRVMYDVFFVTLATAQAQGVTRSITRYNVGAYRDGMLIDDVGFVTQHSLGGCHSFSGGQFAGGAR